MYVCVYNIYIYIYTYLGSLFNHESLYANVQTDDSVAATAFDLANWAQWKPLDPAAIAGMAVRPRCHYICIRRNQPHMNI